MEGNIVGEELLTSWAKYRKTILLYLQRKGSIKNKQINATLSNISDDTTEGK